ncbi:hypothetical protein [Clostridium sp. M14]|uniref:hypothetical protein n=1 Tax=Clostridium sp. M14 TaxID=2716311 RepID=UPI0013EEA781|nr:hypothetical protein [Clostridium sp. M14]MBZ9691204.1 hypothetical protein [Clostridium sp. M14]
MNLQGKNKIPKTTFVLNILATVMGIFAIFNLYTSYKYIAGLIEKGFDPIKQLSDVINYYLNSVTQYVFYGICLFTLGYIIKKVAYLVDAMNVRKLDKKHLAAASVENDEDDEIDRIFKNLEG